MNGVYGGARPYLFLTLLALILFAPGLAELPPMDRDESRFMQATRQMLESGDFIRIQFQDEMRAKKPAGAYWIQALSVWTLSDPSFPDPAPYRLPSALAAWAVMLMTFGFGRSLIGERPALLGAVLVGTALMVVSEAHQAKTDALLLACVTLAQGILARFYVAAKAKESKSAAGGSSCSSGGCGTSSDQTAQGPGNGEILLFWLAQGVGILIKGPIVPLVSVMTILSLAIADRGCRWFVAMRPLTGSLVVAALAAPWFVAVSSATGGAFLGTAVKTDLLPKLLGAQESHGGFPGLYLALSPFILWPGSLILLPAATQMWQQRKRLVFRVLLAWAVPTWILFELIPTKLPHYILPALPALALMAAALLAEGIEIFRRPWMRVWYAIWAALGLVVAGLVVGAPIYLGHGFSVSNGVAALGIVLASLLPMYLMWSGRFLPAALALSLTAVASYPVLFAGVIPSLDQMFLSRAVGHVVSTIGSQGPVVAAGYSEPSLVFQLGTKTRFVDGAGAASHLLRYPGALAVVSDKEQAAFLGAIQAQGQRVDSFGQVDGLNYSRGKRTSLTVYGVVSP